MLDWTRLERRGDPRREFEDLAFAITERRFRGGSEGTVVSVDDRGGGHGVEFYLKRPDGEVWGWQTKWFYPGARLDQGSRKNQIKKSLARAVRTEPKVTRFILWTPEAFTTGEEEWYQEELRSSVHDGEPVVPDGYDVELVHEYGGHIESRLAEPAFAGLRNYFFGDLELAPEWYRRRYDRALQSAGSAYRPHLHTVTSVESHVDLVLWTERGLDRIKGHIERTLEWIPDLDPVLATLADARSFVDEPLATDVVAVVQPLSSGGATLTDALRELVDAESLAAWEPDSADHVLAACEDLRRAGAMLSEITTRHVDTLWPRTDGETAGGHTDPTPPVLHVRDAVTDAMGLVDTLYNYAGMLSVDLRLSQASDVHLLGDAGAGKSHLAFHVVGERVSAGAPAVLLLGREFTTEAPLRDQIRCLLDVPPDYSWADTLAVLSADAIRCGHRLPIVIDGLNEAVVGGRMSSVWGRDLQAVSDEIGQHPGLVLITTTRPSYVDLVWPDGLPDHIAEIQGFGHEAVEAADKYFEAYGIEPAEPEELPEIFHLPIFLRLYCEGFDPQGRPHRVHLGEQSQIQAVERFVERAADRIGRRLTGRASGAPVETALRRLSLELWNRDARAVPVDRAVVATDLQPLGAIDWQGSFAGALESEGLLLARDAAGGDEILFFTYDLVAGYAIARALLDEAGGDLEGLFSDPTTQRRLFGEPPPSPPTPPSARSLFHRASDWTRVRLSAARSWARGRLQAETPPPETQTPGEGAPVALGKAHPLATDVRRVLAALLLERRGVLLHERCSHPHAAGVTLNALFEVEPAAIPDRAVTWVGRLWDRPDLRPRLLDHARSVWNVPNHPLGAAFWSRKLGELSVAERDLAWSEYVRRSAPAFEAEAAALEATARSICPLTDSEHRRLRLRSRRLAWALTTTIHPLRDRITRALYHYARRFPEDYTDLLDWSIGVNDPYVPERVVAAAYGAAMALAFGPGADAVREGPLSDWARSLDAAFFDSGASRRTTHALLRDYAASLITLVVDAEREASMPSGGAWRPPYAPGQDWEETDGGAGDSYPGPITYIHLNKIQDDLVDGYPRDEDERQRVVRQLYTRVFDLGYDRDRFIPLEEDMARRYDRSLYYGPHGTEPGVVDLYSGKYVRIATFELVGHRTDLGLIEHHEGRYHDVDLDPSFPEPPRDAAPIAWGGTGGTDLETPAWVSGGGLQDVRPFFELDEIDGHQGPWTMLYAYTDETDFDLQRRRHTHVQAVLVLPSDIDDLESDFVDRESRSGWGLGDLPGRLYLFAGEAPWHPEFPDGRERIEVVTGVEIPTGETRLDVRVWDGDDRLGDDRARDLLREAVEELATDATVQDAIAWFEGRRLRAELEEVVVTKPERRPVDVVVPAYASEWESYHTTLTSNWWGMCPTGSLCAALGLTPRPQTFDVFDPEGRRASLHVRHDEDSAWVNTQRALFLRTDLIDRYLADSGLALVWLVSTERTWDHETYNARRVPDGADWYANNYSLIRRA